MSQILRDLNKLAEKMGAPVVGQNISEQVRAISTFYGGTTHGANINERINEVRQAYHETSGESTADFSLGGVMLTSEVGAFTKEDI